MKLDYLAEGSDLCPLLRLYDFTSGEAQQLRSEARRLASASSRVLAVHDLPFVEGGQDCRLTWCLTDTDRGVVAHGASVFTCELSASGWAHVVSLIEPFAHLPQKGFFQWLIGGLNTAHSPSLLLSPDGQW
jgi:hypothetical protein